MITVNELKGCSGYSCGESNGNWQNIELLQCFCYKPLRYIREFKTFELLLHRNFPGARSTQIEMIVFFFHDLPDILGKWNFFGVCYLNNFIVDLVGKQHSDMFCIIFFSYC